MKEKAPVAEVAGGGETDSDDKKKGGGDDKKDDGKKKGGDDDKKDGGKKKDGDDDKKDGGKKKDGGEIAVDPPKKPQEEKQRTLSVKTTLFPEAVIPAPVEAELDLGFYRLTVKPNGKCTFSLYYDKDDCISVETGEWADVNAAEHAMNDLRKKGKNAPADNSLAGKACGSAPKYVVYTEGEWYYYKLVDKDGKKVLLQSLRYFNPHTCIRDLQKTRLCITSQKKEVVTLASDSATAVPTEETPQ